MKTSIANIIRPDASSYHTFFFDMATNEPLRGETHQGFSDDSSWARGQSWAVYGLALCYHYTHAAIAAAEVSRGSQLPSENIKSQYGT